MHHQHSNVDTIAQSDEDHQIIDKLGDPNLLLDDVEMTETPSRILTISDLLSSNDMVEQNHLVLDELGDPNLILDEDQRARSQIKGKVGRNTKIKSSKRPNPDSILQTNSPKCPSCTDCTLQQIP